MPELLIQNRWFVQLVKRTIHLDPLKPLLTQLKKLFAILAFAVTYYWCQQISPCIGRHRHHPVDHVLNLLGLNRLARCRTVRGSGTGKQQPQIIIYFSDSPNRRARIFTGGLLLNRNRRTETANVIDVRLFHHIQKLARISRERFHIAPLPFGIDGVKRQRGFSRPR